MKTFFVFLLLILFLLSTPLWGENVSDNNTSMQEVLIEYDNEDDSQTILATDDNLSIQDIVVEENNIENSKEHVYILKKNWWLATGEAIASNLILLGVNRFVRQAPYAFISWDSMHYNLTNPWVWDQDEFAVNQLGHPYQGSFYFIAGRANNLNFWESYIPTVLGSVMWEIFMETERPSINDFIVTTTGGAVMGEILHRLYLEAEKVGPWFSWIISPMSALNMLITGKPSMKVPEKIESLTLLLSVGSVLTFFGIENRLDFHKNKRIPISIGAGLNLVYGKPYGHETTTPFSHFEIDAKFDWSLDYYSFSLFTYGLLWSISPPWNSENADTTFGISQHYDVIFSEALQFSANSVGVTFKQKIFLPKDFIFTWNLHINVLILGSTEYYYFLSGEIPKPESGEERRDYDLGSGENIKLRIDITNPKMGTFSIWYMFNGLHIFAGGVPEHGSPGYTILGIAGFSYEHMLNSPSYLLGLSSTLYHKVGFYSDANKVTNLNNYVSVYFKLKFK